MKEKEPIGKALYVNQVTHAYEDVEGKIVSVFVNFAQIQRASIIKDAINQQIDPNSADVNNYVSEDVSVVISAELAKKVLQSILDGLNERNV